MQFIIIILVIVLSIVYALLRIYKLFVSEEDPCAGCSGCDLKRENGVFKSCELKKSQKNLQERKK